MKLAIITVTFQGRELARRLSHLLEQDHTILVIDIFHKNVKKTLIEIFHQYDCILGIMASGIMIRSICPLMKNKLTDPAVLIMDEGGKHIISFLSGHFGGGNHFALKIAEVIGADPVITTATDVQGKMGIDTLARKYFFTLKDPFNVVVINQALVNGEMVQLAVSPQFEYLFKDDMVKKSYVKVKSSISPICYDNFSPKACYDNKCVFLTSNKLVMGIGARRNVSKNLVMAAVKETLHDLEIPSERIDVIATAEPKKEEKGILDVTEELGKPLEVVSLELLKNFKHPDYSESAWVRETFGVPGVCEPAALLVAGESSRLIYRKRAFKKVTIAVAISSTS